MNDILNHMKKAEILLTSLLLEMMNIRKFVEEEMEKQDDKR